MNNNYDINAKIFKALGDSNRLKIIDMLSCGEKCACGLLEFFELTQPTLSQHMKVLSECGLVLTRKEGTWNYYRLNLNNANKLALFLMNIITDTDNCICKKDSGCCS
ncbi:MAG: metalloregulator ArsR/SmtB family transcription factor [Clostridium sp.]|uniref:ArsR/SmtB family transcription factor n=1 Tax=Clostridium sp. TaxID=1506 RepID=UPI002FC90D90